MKNRTLAESAGFTSRRPALVPQVDHLTSSDHPWSLVQRGRWQLSDDHDQRIEPFLTDGGKWVFTQEQVVLRVHLHTNGSLRDLQKGEQKCLNKTRW